jgi:hypothetical protein
MGMADSAHKRPRTCPRAEHGVSRDGRDKVDQRAAPARARLRHLHLQQQALPVERVCLWAKVGCQEALSGRIACVARALTRPRLVYVHPRLARGSSIKAQLTLRSMEV